MSGYSQVAEKELDHREIMRAEQSPDVYYGEECDQHKPQWIGWAEGDKGGPGPCGDERGSIVLSPETFPAGAVISISVPMCPDCCVDAELCECGFDWREWASIRYS